jgi:hypothetical protein
MASRFLMCAAAVLCASCVPLNPSTQDVVGLWRVECEGGVETIDLKSDNRYVYTIDSSRRRGRFEGSWVIEPRRERLESARLVLRGAPQSCENATAFPESARRGDNVLAPVWEWGHVELSYHPDLGGFTRVRASKR